MQTALPKAGGNVIIVGKGENKGEIGKLLERNSKKDKVLWKCVWIVPNSVPFTFLIFAQATVQLNEDLSIQTFSFDDVCEYVGEEGVTNNFVSAKGKGGGW